MLRNCGIAIVLSLLVLGQCSGRTSRPRREAEEAIKTAETRIDPYMYEGGYGPGMIGGGYGVGPLGAVGGAHLGPVGTAHLGPVGGLMYKAPYLEPHGGYGGYLRSGVNDGVLALGNKGEQVYKQGNTGGFYDGSYNAGGGLQQGGYQSGEGYKDNKHHEADDHSNRVFYNNQKGGRKDIGNGQVFDKNQGYSENSFNKLGANEEKGHQRGHHKTGFHKSYHKDESGKDESYFDSDHDLGNHEYGKKYADEYGSNYKNGMKGGQNLNEYASNERGENGYQGNGKVLAHNQGYKDRFGNTQYYDNENRFGKHSGGQGSDLGKYGYQNDFLNGYNNGRNFEGSHIGGGHYAGY